MIDVKKKEQFKKFSREIYVAFDGFKADFIKLCAEYSVKDEKLPEKAEKFNRDEIVYIPPCDINVETFAEKVFPDLKVKSYAELLEIYRERAVATLNDAMDEADKLCAEYLDGKFADDDYMRSMRVAYNAVYDGYTHLILDDNTRTKYEAPRFKKADPKLDW